MCSDKIEISEPDKETDTDTVTISGISEMQVFQTAA